MSEQRLSRLQKWILIEAYTKGKRLEEPHRKDEIYFIARSEIYNEFYKLSGTIPKTKVISVNRSVRRLIEKGYCFRKQQVSGYVRPRVYLTDMGIHKAKSITTSPKGTGYTIRD